MKIFSIFVSTSITVTSFFASGCKKEAPIPKAPPVQVAETPPLKIVGRRIDITVKNDGYTPNTIALKQGEEVALVFTRVEEGECAEEVVIPETGARAKLPLKIPVALPYKAVKSGEVLFACGMNMLHGLLVISQ